jgi:hypothetical protein
MGAKVPSHEIKQQKAQVSRKNLMKSKIFGTKLFSRFLFSRAIISKYLCLIKGAVIYMLRLGAMSKE